jgi:hypothetical protein
VKYERTDRFKRDYRQLSEGEQDEFKRVIREEFAPAASRFVTNPGEPWPRRLRVKGVKGAPGVWEMTWSFTDPDGRATFEWMKIDEEAGIRWRRVGSHGILASP